MTAVVALDDDALDVCGRPSTSAAPATSPRAIAWRTIVDDHGGSPPTSPTASTAKPWAGAELARVSTFPLARWPKRKFDPTTTAAACSASTSTRCTNPSGDQDAISRLKGSTSTWSSPRSASSRTRWSMVVSAAGARSGRARPSGAGRRSPRPRARPHRGRRPRAGRGRGSPGARGALRRSCRW